MTTVIVTARDVSGWLYLLIGVSVVVTVLLTSRVLDNLATPVRLEDCVWSTCQSHHQSLAH